MNINIFKMLINETFTNETGGNKALLLKSLEHLVSGIENPQFTEKEIFKATCSTMASEGWTIVDLWNNEDDTIIFNNL